MNNFLDSWLNKWDRVVVFAGVFDPVHIGHLSAAETALRHGKRVVFLPERIPQHKHGSTDYKHRLEMLRLATQHNKRFDVLDYDQDHQFIEPVFSWLQLKYPESSFVWLVGSDVVEQIPTWSGADKLNSLFVVDVLYLDRDGDERPETVKISNSITAHKIKRTRYRSKHKKHAVIRSKTVRGNLATHHTQLIHEVYEYIKANNLYKA